MDNFNINAIRTELAAKRIVIEATLDIDPDSIGYETIKITEKESKRIIDYTAEVKFDTLILHLEEWPQPGIEYLIKIQGITSVMGDEMPASLQRKIYFESEVHSLAEIVRPANFEKINSLEVELREIVLKDEASPVGVYHIEIARENGFYNVVRSTVSETNTLGIMDLDPGQYFIRARVQSGESYSLWSSVKTFVVEPVLEQPEGSFSDSSADPVIDLPLRIIEKPEDGTTPNSFVFRFNANLDPSAGENIRIIKRRV